MNSCLDCKNSFITEPFFKLECLLEHHRCQYVFEDCCYIGEVIDKNGKLFICNDGITEEENNKK